MAADTYDKQLEHIRLVHFAGLAVAAVCAYLVLSAKGKTEELRSELTAFARGYSSFVHRRDTSQLLGGELEDVNPTEALEEICAVLELATCKRSPVGLGWQGWQVRPSLPLELPSDTDATIEGIVKAVAAVTWLRPRIAAVELSNELKALQAFVKKHSRAYVYFSFRTMDKPDSRVDDFLGWKTIHRDEYAKDKTRGTFFVLEATSHFEPSDNPANEIRARMGVLVLDLPSRLNRDWFTRRYPVTAAHLTELGGLKPLAARSEAARFVGRLHGAKASLLGIDIDGDDLAVAGPVALLVSFLYLFVYVDQLRSNLDQNGEGRKELAPLWVGTSANAPAQALFLATLAVPVATAILIAAFSGTALATIVSILACAVAFGVGVECISIRQCLNRGPRTVGALAEVFRQRSSGK